MIIDLDIAAFRANFSAYADETEYSDMKLLSLYEIGKCYIADNDCTLAEKCREYALQLMLAHLLYIQDLITAGQPIRVITSASEKDVSVSLAEPPSASNWNHWLNISPYGMQVLSMLDVASVGGFYVGGSPEKRGFRKINGGY